MNYILTTNNELYHHGVKGMKWGVRRYQNVDGSLTPAGKEKLSKYIKKESQIIAKRRLRELKREDKILKRETNRFNNVLDKYGTDSPNGHKAAYRYVTKKAKIIAKDNLAKAEVKRVMTMTLDDVRTEKKAIGRDRIRATLTNIGSVGILALGSPVGVFTSSNKADVKTRNRVDKDSYAKIQQEAMNEAFHEIYS